MNRMNGASHTKGERGEKMTRRLIMSAGKLVRMRDATQGSHNSRKAGEVRATRATSTGSPFCNSAGRRAYQSIGDRRIKERVLQRAGVRIQSPLRTNRMSQLWGRSEGWSRTTRERWTKCASDIVAR